VSRLDFRPFVPKGASARIAGATAREHAHGRVPDRATNRLWGAWDRLAAEPFRGVTANGVVMPGLYRGEPNGAPVEAMVGVVAALLGVLSADERTRCMEPMNSERWRHWQNTEAWLETHGLRLADVDVRVREAVLAVVRVSSSGPGYRTVRDVMRLNAFIGYLINAPAVLGEWTFTFVLFGEPHHVEPWGWQLFGHHLAVNCVVVNHQLILSPIFFGAEPSYADAGPFAGTALFEDEERDGLGLLRALSSEQRARAIVSEDMMVGDLPPGRRHFADNLNLGGAFQDNRIIPYEGLVADALDGAQRRRLLALIERYLGTLPPEPLSWRMAEVENHLDETHFCWIGNSHDDSPFYYRIQSPVVMIEFDHHIGVFLTNAEPQKFHVHTIVRTPNGNDYGMDVLGQHYARAHRGKGS